MLSKASLAWLSFATGVWIGWVLLRASALITVLLSLPAFSHICQSGLKWSVALTSIQEANPSLSQRLSHHAMVTRSPNHWCAISWATVTKISCLVSCELALGLNSRTLSL